MDSSATRIENGDLKNLQVYGTQAAVPTKQQQLMAHHHNSNSKKVLGINIPTAAMQESMTPTPSKSLDSSEQAKYKSSLRLEKTNTNSGTEYRVDSSYKNGTRSSFNHPDSSINITNLTPDLPRNISLDNVTPFEKCVS